MQVGFCWVTHAPIRDSRYRDDMVPDSQTRRLPTLSLPARRYHGYPSPS